MNVFLETCTIDEECKTETATEKRAETQNLDKELETLLERLLNRGRGSRDAARSERMASDTDGKR